MSAKKKYYRPKPSKNKASFAEKFFSPQLAFSILLFVVGAVPVAVGNFWGTTFVADPIVSVRIFVLCVGMAITGLSWIGCLIRNCIPARLHNFFWLLAAFVILSFVSSVTATSPYAAFFGGLDNPFGFFTYLSLIALFILTNQLIKDQAHLLRLSKVVLFSGVAVAAIAWIQRITSFDPITGFTIETAGPTGFFITRGMGTLANPDFLGHFLLVPALLALAFFSFSSTQKDRLIYAASFFLTAGAIIGSATRGAILALLIGLVFYFAMSVLKRYEFKLGLILVVATLALSFVIAIPISARTDDSILRRTPFLSSLVEAPKAPAASPENPENNAALAEAEEAHLGSGNFGGRLPMWQTVLEIVKADPLFGIGPANTMNGWRLNRTAESLVLGSGAIMTDAHNLILELFATVGIPATLCAAAFLLGVFYLALRTDLKALRLEENSQPRGRILHLSWTASLITLMVSMLTNMSTLPWMSLLFINLAVSLSPHMREVDISYPLQRERNLIKTASVIGLIASFTFFIFGTLYFTSSLVNASAIGAKDPLARLRLATKFAPFNLNQMDYVARRHQIFASKTSAPDAEKLEAINHSIALYEDVLKKAPRSYDPYYGLALAHYIKSELGVDPGPELAKGHEYTRKGLLLYPAALDLRNAAAIALNSVGRYQEAYDMLKDWVGFDKANTGVEDTFKAAQAGLDQSKKK